MQNLLGTTQSRLAQSLSTQSKQSLSLTHGLFHKVINIGGGANTLHSLDKSPKNTLYSYKSAKPTKQLFHALIARGFNESPKQSSLSVIARFNNAESKKSAQFVIARFVCELCKSVGFSWQSKPSLKSRILDCFDFLQKSRNDRVGGIVIAICFAFCAVIARFGNAKSWQSKLSVIARALPEAIHKIKSFCFVWLLPKVESLYPTDSNPQSEIPLIRSWLIYFTHRFKSRVLDTSLRNATLSMTKMRGLLRRFVESPRNDGVGRFGNTESQKFKHFVIARICVSKFVAIHFSDFRITQDSLTLGESMRLRFTRFVRFRLPCLDTQRLANTQNIRLCERVL